jgi:shikimate dehydrogenase
VISGTTAFVAMLGHPVHQVRTPAAFNAWAQQRNVDAVMIAIDVAPASLATTLTALRGWQNCLGAVVTYPHKQAVVAELDSLTDAVRIVGAANVIRRMADGHLHGGMTDGLGMVTALRNNGFDPTGRAVRLIGAGGAGSAIALALLDAGVARLVVDDIDADRRSQLLARLHAARPEAVVAGAADKYFAPALVVNATLVGMNGDPAYPIPLDALPPSCLVADIVPTPAVTAWLAAARQRGHPIQTGPEMIAGQLPALITHLLPDAADDVACRG